MRKIVLVTSMISALLLAVFVGSSSIRLESHAAEQDCHPKAIRDLQRLSPRGFAIYEAMQDKKLFLGWLSCDDIQLGLSTAVHESVHNLTEERDAFPLVKGGDIKRPHEVSAFFAPSEIASAFTTRDIFVHDYLRPTGVSSAKDFLYLLDELNAFSHDLDSAVALNSLHRNDRQVDHRDGLAAMMAFVMTYVETARKSQPRTWEGLQKPQPRQVIQTLWSQAETVMASSCGLSDFGSRDRYYLGLICKPGDGEALSRLLDRAPLCPKACLS
ncbi:MAG: hypothetical protein BGP04_25625 [Rhizobiales bacterium 62-17]|nr:hypothetical protein [Hyphomicrobiales bacterium]OJY00877.1 MAG: hypothetical protein BGP04_25625 [Rhizobiales bacterium 62-17]